MTKRIKFKTPVQNRDGERSIEERYGVIAKLYVGPYQEKFVLQEGKTGGTELAHFATGYKLGDLTPIKLRHMRSYKRMTDRAAAEIYIEELIAQHGHELVRSRLAEQPVINE